MTTINRRQFMGKLGGAAAAGLTLPHSSLVWADDNRVTVTALGGRWETSIREHFIPHFQARTGAEVDVVTGGPGQWMAQLESQPDNPPIDAIDNSETLAYRLMDLDLAVKLTEDRVPNLADTPGVFRDPWDDYGVMYMYAGAGFYYNRDVIKEPPKTWVEFFERTAAGEFGRSVSFPDIPYAWTPAFVWNTAEVFGGGIDNLDPGFEALQRIRPYIVKFWANAGEIERMITSRETDIGVFWDGRTYSVSDSGASFLGFQRPDSHVLISGVTSQVVRGGNEALAMEYVNSLLAPEPQRQYFDLINYAVTNQRVEYPEAVRDRILPAEMGVVAPYRELAAQTSELIERWNQEIRI